MNEPNNEAPKGSGVWYNHKLLPDGKEFEGPLSSQSIHFIPGGSVNDDKYKSHPLFCELAELVTDGNHTEWNESARWIKFEEDVEKGGNRWSKPHVATLSLHFLLELHKILSKATVCLDIRATSLEQVTDLVLDNMINNKSLHVDKREKVKRVLLKKHRHQHEKSRNSSSSKSCTLLCINSPPKRKESVNGFDPEENIKGNIKRNGSYVSIPDPEEAPRSTKGLSNISTNKTTGETGLNDIDHNLGFMRKIPKGAEAGNILVGNVDFLDETVCAFVRLNSAVILGDLTEVPIPTHFLFILLGPTTETSSYHEIGRAMGALMSDEVFTEIAYQARNKNQILAGIDEFLEAAIVLPPGEWDPAIRIEPPGAIPSQESRKRPPGKPTDDLNDEYEAQKIREDTGLVRSGVLFGGLINDVKRRAPWYWSEFKDGLSTQCIASWIFLYFACLSPIITFGGLLSEATGRHMAAMESLVSGLICGVGYGLFSGQPLSILGSTGPVLVFEKIVFNFCGNMGWDYMSFRFWIGTWIAVILIIMVAIDASSLVCYITRFTEENFAALIAVIFIYEAILNVLSINDRYPINTTGSTDLNFNCSCSVNDSIINQYPEIADTTIVNRTLCMELKGVLSTGCSAPSHVPDVFLMSVLLFMGTFLISIQLKHFKNSLFFPSWVRQFFSDFAVIIAILLMTLADFKMGIPTPKLEVPREFKPTLPGRSWIIDPFKGNPFYSIFVAIPPALLGTILIFMDQQITSVIINRKEYKLKKGCGYHLDLFILSILIQICSTMGLPWFVAATVLSINHVNSLKLESECAAPGDKPQFLGVREQRVTHILIFLTIGLSIFLTPILGYIPMPVLFGVFLYMGIASLADMQFIQRILIMFMPNKYQPDYMFLRQVPIKKVHLFTIIQISCLVCLWVIKSFSQTSILFPLMLVVMIGVRMSLKYIFTKRELKILDDMMPRSVKRNQPENVKMGVGTKISRFFLGPKLKREKQYIECVQITKDVS